MQGTLVSSPVQEDPMCLRAAKLKCTANQTTWPASWEICMQVRKEQLELNMKQQTGSKKGKEYNKAVYCNHAYLTYTQST